MRRWLFGVIALCLGALAANDASAQQGETRIALIIANEAYVSPNLGRLPGTQRDATAMRAALTAAHFAVTMRTNLTRAQMRTELSAFERRLHELGQGGIGFLYYSGHGAADGPHGQNYLIPVDAHLSDVTDLPTNALAMNEELDAIDVAGARAIVVIDACRNTLVSMGRGVRGLAPVAIHTDTLIAFSTRPNDTAADDGLYAEILARELTQPGANSVDVFARVTSEVAGQTDRRQVPHYENGLVDPIVFMPEGAAPAPTSSSSRVNSNATPQSGRVPRDSSTTRPSQMSQRVSLVGWWSGDYLVEGAPLPMTVHYNFLEDGSMGRTGGHWAQRGARVNWLMPFQGVVQGCDGLLDHDTLTATCRMQGAADVHLTLHRDPS